MVGILVARFYFNRIEHYHKHQIFPKDFVLLKNNLIKKIDVIIKPFEKLRTWGTFDIFREN